MSGASRSLSLAARLVLLFVMGSAVIMAAAGYALYHAPRMQLQAQDQAEVTGKTQVVEHMLRGIDSREAPESSLNRLRDIAIGHPHLNISVLSGGRWLVPPRDDLLTHAIRATESTPLASYVEAHAGSRIWWLHRVRHAWSGASPGYLDVVVAVETTETYKLLREQATAAVIIALLGTVASAVLAWFVAKRGLAPLAQVAARAGQVTAHRLGARLDLTDAPEEVHGLAVSINRMLERLEESFGTLEQFSADIAHELRTPLNNLLLQTQVTLTRPRTSDEYQEALHSNLVEIERLQRMISEMRMLLRRALTNLLSNAVRYSPDAAPSG